MAQNSTGSIPISEKAFIYEKRHSIGRSLFSEESSSSPLKIPVDRCSRKVNGFFLNFNLNTKLITSESILRRSLCRMVVYKILKLQVEIDLAFFLTLILFSSVTIGKEFCPTQDFLQPE